MRDKDEKKEEYMVQVLFSNFLMFKNMLSESDNDKTQYETNL